MHRRIGPARQLAGVGSRPPQRGCYSVPTGGARPYYGVDSVRLYHNRLCCAVINPNPSVRHGLVMGLKIMQTYSKPMPDFFLGYMMSPLRHPRVDARLGDDTRGMV